MFLFLFGILGVAGAAGASFAPAGNFGGILPPTPPPVNPAAFPEDEQLGGAGGLAVNINGAGGVAPGTLYAATIGHEPTTLRIARFAPAGNTLKFEMSWEVPSTEKPYERCGPVLAPPTGCPRRVEAVAPSAGVAVDQMTGNVYVFSIDNSFPGGMAVAIFNADGEEIEGARFGEVASGGVTTESTPEKIHRSPSPGGIAVDGNTVYLFDLNPFDNFYHRLMTFKETTPGAPKTYAYVKGGDIAAGFLGEGHEPRTPVTDAAGDIYVGLEDYVEKYTPSQPKTPVCKFNFSKGGGLIKAMTVNPATGEPFFYTVADKKVHRLGACSGGEFTEIPDSMMPVEPERDHLSALAFDTRKLGSENREPGILYGAAPSAKSGTGGAGEPGMGSLGYIFAPPAENEPVIESQEVSGVMTSGAELEAEINPSGRPTTYTFQYITETAYIDDGEEFGAGTVEVPSPPVIVGSGVKPAHASVLLSGLSPDTAYLFRTIARNNCSNPEPEKVCEVSGSAAPFHTYASEAVGPPDNRAYELVSPPEKSGGQVLPADPSVTSCGVVACKPGSTYNHFPMQSAPEGNAVVYEGTPFTASGSALIENEYIARRTATGWATTNLTPPPMLTSAAGQGYQAFNEGLSEGILEQTEPKLALPAPEGFGNLYLQPTDSLALSPLITEEPPNRSTGNGENSFKTTYAGHSADFAHQIFEANDALTGETAFAPEAVAGTAKENNLYEWASGELRLVNVEPDESTEPGASLGSGTLLKSGNSNSPVTVVDHAISADGKRIFWTSKAGSLFVRENGETTNEIEDPGKFLAASADGSRVLLSDGCLYVLASKSCVDLTAGKAGFLGVAGRSEDLSHIYFVDTAVLSEEENSEGDKAVAGKPNLYVWIDGQPKPLTRFVATLLSTDNGGWEASPAVRTAEASPAGRYLAFQSTVQLTGVDSDGFSEVFLYDSESATLRCPSCNPSGAAPLGRSLLRRVKGAFGSLPQPRYLLDNGRLYFDSRDSLTYRDTNAGVEDVYQYEPQGLGGCSWEGGCVSLVSTGRGPVDSNFLAVDSFGENVFFTTREQLVPADKDQLIDLYDARIGGGFPEPAAPGPCGGETCQPPTPVPAESQPAPPPAGAGNYKPPKCKKGQVRRQGKCVKKPKKKSKQGSKGKGKAKKQGGSK